MALISRRSLLSTIASGVAAVSSANAQRKSPTAIATPSNAVEIDVSQFGFLPAPVDNTAAQEAMRLHAIANPGSIYRFPGGHQYNLSTPRFLFGVRNIEIVAHGASFRNKKAGTFGYSDLNAAFYIGSGSYFHPMNGGNLDVGRATSGDLVQDIHAGQSHAVLVNQDRAAAYKPDTWALIHWFSRQKRSFPPNPGYFEYVKVKSVDAGRGVLTFNRDLRYSYRAIARDDWADKKIYGSVTGRARILSLERPDYTICERFVLRGGTGLVSGFGGDKRDPYDGIIEIAGAIDVEIQDVEFKGFFPTMTRGIKVRRSRFPGVSELDKIVEQLEFEDCTIADISQGTGVQKVQFKRGSLTSNSKRRHKSEIRAREIKFEGVHIHAQGPIGSWSQIGIDAYPKTLVDVDGCTFYPNGRQKSAFVAGGAARFMPDEVTPEGMAIAPDNLAIAAIMRGIDFGSTISLMFGAKPEIFKVRDILFDKDGWLRLVGGYNVPIPTSQFVPRLLRTIDQFVDRGNNRIVNAPDNFQLLAPTRTVVRPVQGAPASGRTFEFDIRSPGFQLFPIQGYVTSLAVDVEKSYSGTGQIASLDILAHRMLGSYRFGTIDLSEIGTRTADIRRTKGSRARDKWGSAIPRREWVELLALHAHGASHAKFDNSDRRTWPRVKVVVTTN